MEEGSEQGYSKASYILGSKGLDPMGLSNNLEKKQPGTS